MTADQVASQRPLAITPGEPAGIGPDICLQLAASGFAYPAVCIASIELLTQRAKTLGMEIHLRPWQVGETITPKKGELWVKNVDLNTPCTAGELNPLNARYVLETLDQAIEGCLKGDYSAIVTAPVHKGVINDFGVAFQGHTEYLQEKCGVKRVVMMLATEELRVALVTTHLPLAQVPAAITGQTLTETIDITLNDLHSKFGLSKPRVLVAGLNPHAGEGGHMGTEEQDLIEPVLARYRALGHELIGPLPADTLFTPHHLEHADAVIAMYHDQGLPVLKYQGFGRAINITLGLPIIRTSVDHGTALDLAGTGQANAGSLNAALVLAGELAQQNGAQEDA